MPWLPLYADRTDIAEILSVLNEDENIGFIVADGPKRWKAVSSVGSMPDGRHCLWIHTAGPLPLVGQHGTPDRLVADPWSGWQETRTGADSTQPYFGPGSPVVVWFNVRTIGKTSSGIGLSGFEWIGNHYRVLGNGAPAKAEKWWQSFGRRLKKNAERIPRSGPPDGPQPEIWARPSARARITAGEQRDANP